MNDDLTLDGALAEIISLSEQIEAKAPEDPVRAALENRRRELRAEVREASDASRPEAVLHNELGMLLRRLAQIDDRPIGRGWAEKGHYRWVNDPGAYSNQINSILDGQDADERTAIIERIGELESLLGGEGDGA